MKLQIAYKTILALFISISLALGISSCGGDDVPQGKGIFTLISNHRIDFAPLVLNSSFAYENEAGNLFKVYEFSYYISDVRLIKSGGGEYAYPMVNDGSKGYFLIDATDPESRLIILRDVPVGNYSGVRFKVGVEINDVDLANAVGPLSTNKQSYSEQYGYYSVFLEGMSYESAEEDRRMAMRTASPTYETTIEFNGEIAIVEDELETVVEYSVDLGSLFNGDAAINFGEQAVLLNPSENSTSAQQFSQAFTFDHLHNNP